MDEIRQPVVASRFRIISHFANDTVLDNDTGPDNNTAPIVVSPSTTATSAVTNFTERVLKLSQLVSHQTVWTGIKSRSPSTSGVVNSAIRCGSDRTCGENSDPIV